MKFSFRQILASTAGAVIAAVVASTFGVKGTIVGVAIGSAAATMGTAFVAQSIERGHEAVKQVAVRAPETSTLLRKLGGTGVSEPLASSVDASSAPTEVVGQPQPTAHSGQAGHDGEAETVEMASMAAPVAETQRLEISAETSAPATERLSTSTTPTGAAVVRPTLLWRLLLAGHCRQCRDRLRAGAAVHHGGRADFGQAAFEHLRGGGHRDHVEEPRQPGADACHHSDIDPDHDDADHDGLHYDDHDRRSDDEHHRADGSGDNDVPEPVNDHDDVSGVRSGSDDNDDIGAVVPLKPGLTTSP